MMEKLTLGGATSEDWFPQEEEEQEESVNKASILSPIVDHVQTQAQRTRPSNRKEAAVSYLKRTGQVCRRNDAKAVVNVELPDPVIDQQKRTDAELAGMKWQPLSLSALSDLPSVTQKTASGSGQFSHGHHHNTWKQNSVVV